MSELEVAKVEKQYVWAKMTNMPIVMLAALFYVLSIVFTAHVIITAQKFKNVDATFQQVGVALNQITQAGQK